MDTIQNRYGLITRKGPLSLIAVIVLSALALGLMLTAADYMEQTQSLNSDVVCYYNYLPAAFKYHSFEFDQLPMRWGFITSPEGYVVEKTTMGMAFLYLPFYLVVWLCVTIGGLSDFEYGPPFALAIMLSAVFYGALGLIFLRKILLNFFSDLVTTLGLAAVFLGTNMLYYTSYEGPMSHVYVFFLISAFIWLMINWHRNPTWKTTIYLGLISGLLTLVRPSTLTIVLFAALYAVYDRYGWKLKLQLIRENVLKILLMAALAIVVWIPQLIYWKSATGHFLFFSYTGERFFWDAPLIHLGFFSYRNGWLMYSPVMIFSVIGLFFLNGELKRFRWGIMAVFLITIYMIYSWWCWWWVGLGSRAMIELYPLLAISLCAFLNWLLSRHWIPKTLILVVFTGLFLVGLFKNYQYKKHLIHYDGMNSKAYWAGFFKTSLPEGYFNMLKSPDYDKAKKGNRSNN